MNKTKLKRFKEMYEAERRNIVALLRLKDDELDIEGDDIDQVQGRTLSAMFDKLSDRDINRLNRIDTALKRIADGTFGDCESCGDEIGERRLEALPGTELCVRCAELEERELRAYAAV